MLKIRQRKYFLLIRRNFQSLVFIFLLSATFFYFGKSKIEEIDCQINKTPCKEEVKKEFSEFIGQNFFLVDTRDKIRKIKASHPHWQKVVAKKIPFNKITLEITTRQPVTSLLVGNIFLLLDREAVIVGEVDVNPGLPEIEAEKFNSEEVKKALEVIFLVDQYSISFKRLKIKSQDELLLFLPETEVILPTKNLSEKIASLQMIQSRAKIEGKLPIRIDLRFQKPVVTF